MTFAAPPTVARALARPANGFAQVRLALALAVVVSHAFSVTTGRVEAEPLHAWTGFTLGEHAVNGFFAISGFLVTMSFDRRGARDYALARVLRIVPGLIAATLVVALGFGTALTRLPASTYLGDPALWRFIQGTLTTFKSSAALPGVFADNPFAFPMGTVWTLKYEVLCYLGVLGFGLAGGLRSRGPAIALAGGLFLALFGLDLVRPDASLGLRTALRLSFLFAAGGALYVGRDRLLLSGPVLAGLAAATALASDSFAYPALLFATTAYGIVWLAFAPVLAGHLRDDLSYGIYLYGWPIQQALREACPAASSWALLAPALGLTVLIAWLSWRWVECPALALKARALASRVGPAIPPARP